MWREEATVTFESHGIMAEMMFSCHFGVTKSESMSITQPFLPSSSNVINPEEYVLDLLMVLKRGMYDVVATMRFYIYTYIYIIIMIDDYKMMSLITIEENEFMASPLL